jgi:dUTPase
MLELKVFLEPGGKCPQKGKQGDAGFDCFAKLDNPVRLFTRCGVKIPLGFRYAFFEDGQVSSNYWLEIKNRSGVGTKYGLTELAAVCDASYRGIPHYSVSKTIDCRWDNDKQEIVDVPSLIINDGDKICQALIHPFVDPHAIRVTIVDTIDELGITERGSDGFGSSGT